MTTYMKDCDRCKKEFPEDKLKQHVWSTRHMYKGRNDNPIVSSSVTFHMVSDNAPAYLCHECIRKTISEMNNGGNWG